MGVIGDPPGIDWCSIGDPSGGVYGSVPYQSTGLGMMYMVVSRGVSVDDLGLIWVSVCDQFGID